MELNTYMAEALRTASSMQLNPRDRLANWALGLVGEAGEAANTIKKILFHDHAPDLTEITSELGDVLWYVAVLSAELEIDLETVAQENIKKLRRRYPNGFTPHDSVHRER